MDTAQNLFYFNFFNTNNHFYLLIIISILLFFLLYLLYWRASSHLYSKFLSGIGEKPVSGTSPPSKLILFLITSFIFLIVFIFTSFIKANIADYNESFKYFSLNKNEIVFQKEQFPNPDDMKININNITNISFSEPLKDNDFPYEICQLNFNFDKSKDNTKGWFVLNIKNNQPLKYDCLKIYNIILNPIHKQMVENNIDFNISQAKIHFIISQTEERKTANLIKRLFKEITKPGSFFGIR